MQKNLFKYLVLLLFSVTSFSVLKAQTTLQFKGIVVSTQGEALPSALVVVNHSKSTVTDLSGKFNLTIEDAGRVFVEVSYLGYLNFTDSLDVSALNGNDFTIKLKQNTVLINDVEIHANTVEEEKRRTGYSVEVLTTKQVQNLSADLNQVIKTTPGINIRETGGLGSGFSLSLNGLSGNQIRYFIDGVPMENFGSSMSLNNFPVNQIKNIEVYKGVVPISLGADALGGAINIVSALKNKSYLDASYSFGSFNTHRYSVTAQHVNKKKNAYIKFNNYFNYSDNNYLMKAVPVYDLELGNSVGEIDIERFNDQYSSKMISVEGGILNKRYSDELSLKLTYADNKNYYQHPDNNILRPFGDFHNRNNTTLATIVYTKKWEKFEVRAFASGGNIESQVIDTSSFKYNWAGDRIRRASDDPKGELFTRRSLFVLTDQVFRNQLQLGYKTTDNGKLDFSWSQNYLHREGEDEVDELNRSFSVPNSISKNILGISYTQTNKLETVEVVGFAKQYLYSGKISTFNSLGEESNSNPTLSNLGFGLAISYQLTTEILLKGSFENAYRYPEGFEILGDGIYVNPNPSLQPEISQNFNLGIRAKQEYKRFNLTEEIKGFYRNSDDFIRFNPIGPFGEYENLSNVNSTGIEANLKAEYDKRYMLTANVTYQNLTDQTKTDEGFQNDNYLSRLPNIPYLFGNARVGVHLLRKTDRKLIAYWSVNYVKDFFLTWKNSGNLADKNIIPSQVVQNFDLEYSIKEGKYNASLSVNNLTNELVYDNFNIQKPGRAVYLKLRYFISKNNQ